VPGGPTYREAQLCMEMIADTRRLASLDVVELNPAFDVHNRTAILAVDLIESLFGKSTLVRRPVWRSPAQVRTPAPARRRGAATTSSRTRPSPGSSRAGTRPRRKTPVVTAPDGRGALQLLQVGSIMRAREQQPHGPKPAG